VGQAHINEEGKSWKAARCDVAGEPRERRVIAVYLVGPAGAALIDYHVMVTRTHRLTLAQLKECGKKGEYLPPIESRTQT